MSAEIKEIESTNRELYPIHLYAGETLKWHNNLYFYSNGQQPPKLETAKTQNNCYV